MSRYGISAPDDFALMRSYPSASYRFHVADLATIAVRAVHACTLDRRPAEFWNVATRPAGLDGLGLSHEEALQEVSRIEESLTLLPDVPAVYAAWKRIVYEHRVPGVKVYDARLVAIMSVYAVESVLTFNTADFKRYDRSTPFTLLRCSPSGSPYASYVLCQTKCL